MRTKEMLMERPDADAYLCEMFAWYFERVDLELQSATFENEWEEYEIIRNNEELH